MRTARFLGRGKSLGETHVWAVRTLDSEREARPLGQPRRQRPLMQRWRAREEGGRRVQPKLEPRRFEPIGLLEPRRQPRKRRVASALLPCDSAKPPGTTRKAGGRLRSPQSRGV